jgi:hypothetical protein
MSVYEKTAGEGPLLLRVQTGHSPDKVDRLYGANEYVFDTDTKAGNFFYTWTQLTYSPKAWLAFGYVVQRTRAYQTPLDIQRGLLVQFTHKKMTFATEVFNLGQADPTVVLSLGYSF